MLLLLRRRWERIWTAPELSGELRSTPGSVLRRLETLARQGLAEQADGGFRFAVSQTAAVDRLAGCYGTHRVAVIEAIFSVERGSRAPVMGGDGLEPPTPWV